MNSDFWDLLQIIDQRSEVHQATNQDKSIRQLKSYHQQQEGFNFVVLLTLKTVY